MQASSPFRRLGAAFTSVSGVPRNMHRRTYDRLKREGMDLETRLSKRMHKDSPTMRFSLRIPTDRFSDR